MFESLVYFALAIFGLGVLIFIHELGHYLMALREGMKVEVFSIGFGPPIFVWFRKGVKWQVCWVPLGGYVRIAGMQREGSKAPESIEGGFYSKTPMQRIRVAFIGPLVNLVFAFLLFAGVWVSGGREKPFAEFTHLIGWVDPKSTLYEEGVRSGDSIEVINGAPFQGVRDLLLASLAKAPIRIQGEKIDYFSKERQPFSYSVNPSDGKSPSGAFSSGVFPARYLIFDDMGKGLAKTLPPGSPMYGSGIQNGDRIIWADGEFVFSLQQLSSLINESNVFLTVRREGQFFQTKVPRVHLDELKLSSSHLAEIDDWQYEADLNERGRSLYFIPYLLSPTGEIESRLDFIDPEAQRAAFEEDQRSLYFHPLEEGDRVVAVDGQPIASSYELLEQLQTRRILMIVDRNSQIITKPTWIQADEEFDRFSSQDLNALVSRIGLSSKSDYLGDLYLLNPVIPLPLAQLPLTSLEKSLIDRELVQTEKQIKAIPDPEQREEALRELDKTQKKVLLGIHLKDREVMYNPLPQRQFKSVLEEMYFTFSSLFTGTVSAKHLSGPVGIIDAVHRSWLSGPKEAVFWMGVVSLNLGILNLLPFPVLDGGHIVFSLFEMVTRRRVQSKMLERLILPFAGLLFGFFLYVTYHDIARIFSRFFN